MVGYQSSVEREKFAMLIDEEVEWARGEDSNDLR